MACSTIVRTTLALLVIAVAWLSLEAAARQGAGAQTFGMRLIVVPSREDAEGVLQLLARGDDFAAVALDHSIDPTASDGGYLGRLDPASLRPELRDALQSVAIGNYTGIVRIPSGFAIVKVLADVDAPSFRDDNNPARMLAAAASGAVRITLPVAGLNEADAVFLGLPKPEGWNQDLRAMCGYRSQSLTTILQKLEETPVTAADESSLDAQQGQYAWAQLLAYRGDLGKAIQRWLVAHEMAETKVPAAVPMMRETLGLAYLHKAGMDSGVFREPGTLCLFPPRDGAAYREAGDVEKAIPYFLKFLEDKPQDLEVRWLLNLAYVALGRYPSGVPEKYLVPASAFESKDDIGRFTDVAGRAGVNVFSLAGGVIVDQFSPDGSLDLITSSMDVCEPLHYFKYNGNGTFIERTNEAGFADQLGGLNIIQADYDNDSCMDILVMRGGLEFAMRRSLLHNNCNGTFTDVTARSHIGDVATSTQTAVWADVDNDGWPDIFVNSYYISNDESVRTYLGLPHNAETSKLFRNLGNGTFRDVTAEVGLDKVWMPMAANFGDVNNDGYLDMYLGMGSPSFAALFPHELLLNKDGKSFVSVTASSGTGELHKGHGIAFADIDRDGDEDIVAEIGGAVPADRHALRLFENPGQGSDWINVRLVGVKSNRAAMGAQIKVVVGQDGQDGRVGQVGRQVGRVGPASEQTRSIYRTVGSGGSFGANPLEQHIGLGKSARILSIEIWWPATKTRQTFANVAKNQFIEITESARNYTRLERKAVRLGGTGR